VSQHRLVADLNYIVEHTQSVWPELKGQRIFITGGTGFIGTWLLEALLWANQRLNLNLSLTALTRDPDAFAKKAPHLANDPALQLVAGDVRNFAFPAGEFSHLIHGATSSTAKFYQDDPQLMFDTILQGTRHTLDFAAAAKVQKFLFLSSGAVYGRQPPEMSHLDENFSGGPEALNRNATYAIGKCAAEHLCLLHASLHPIEIKIARCFAFIGPYFPLDLHFAIGNFIRDGLSGNDIVVKSDGSLYRSYQYAADLVVWLLRILQQGDSCVPYNVGSDEAVSIAELAKLVAAQFHSSNEVKIMQKAEAGKLAERYVPSTLRAQVKLGVVNQIGLSEAIQKTIAWHRNLKS
jgi:nucleoside-diphosphate-sugar epimerase